MKILHIINTAGISGAEKYLKHLLPGLGHHGIDCGLMFICPPGAVDVLTDFADEFISKGVKTTLIVSAKAISFGLLKRINDYLVAENISVVHTHLIRTDIFLSLVKQFFNKKLFIISTKHGYRESIQEHYLPEKFTVKKDPYYYITRYTLKKIDQNISISKGISDLFLNLQLTDKFYPVIPHGVDVPQRSNITDPFFRRYAPQLIIVGRLEDYKGHRYAFEALKIIRRAKPEAHLLLLGKGAAEHQLKALAVELQIENNVHFLGFQKDPYSFISASDVLIVPSLFEPFGLVFIEAMALKTAVATFDVPAGNEIINTTTGVLAARANSKALAEKILDLLDDPEKKEALVENAFKTYKEKYTCEVMVKTTADFYKSLNVGN